MLAVLLAIGAAAVFGTGTALQHRAASGVSRADVASGRLLTRLLQRRSWLLGLCLSGLAFALHVAALHRGSLTLVQPIVVTTTVFAVFVRSALDRTRPDRAEIVWGACTWVGLTLFISAVGTHVPHHHADDRTAALLVLAGAAAAVLASAAARQTRLPTRRGFLLGVSAGILYGLTAGLIKVATTHASLGLLPLLSHWSPWLVAPTGLSAFFLSQRAFHATRLSVSAPVLNIVDVLVAVAFGSAVFGDRVFTSPGQLLVELVGATMIGVGVWRLVREDERLHETQARVDLSPAREAPRVETDQDASG
jgi:drug/metabolite transporter (DMT)-like permease